MKVLDETTSQSFGICTDQTERVVMVTNKVLVFTFKANGEKANTLSAHRSGQKLFLVS